MKFGYLTRDLYRNSVRNPRHIKVRSELLEISKGIGTYFYPERKLWPCQHWSRVWELPWAIDQAGRVKGKKVLDIGPWLSPLGTYLAGKGASVTALDIEPHELPGVEVVHGDLRTWRSRRKFDVVTCISVLEHVERMSLADMVQRAEKRLLPGGKLIVTFDIPLAPQCPFGVRPPEFGDLLAWMQNERGVQLPRFPFKEGAVSSTSFAAQANYVGAHIGVCYLEATYEDSA